MLLKATARGPACDCAAHRASSAATERASFWAVSLPILACVLCPACLTTYAKLLSVAGVGVGLSELHHALLLALAVAASIAVSARRSIQSRRAWPIAVALTGAVLVGVGHVWSDLHALEWPGVLVLLAGGLAEHFRLRRSPRTPKPLPEILAAAER